MLASPLFRSSPATSPTSLRKDTRSHPQSPSAFGGGGVVLHPLPLMYLWVGHHWHVRDPWNTHTGVQTLRLIDNKPLLLLSSFATRHTGALPTLPLYSCSPVPSQTTPSLLSCPRHLLPCMVILSREGKPPFQKASGGSFSKPLYVGGSFPSIQPLHAALTHPRFAPLHPSPLLQPCVVGHPSKVPLPPRVHHAYQLVSVLLGM